MSAPPVEVRGGNSGCACNETVGPAAFSSGDVPGSSAWGTTGDNIGWTEEAADWDASRTRDLKKGGETLAPSAVENNASIPIEIEITTEIMNESQLPDG